MTHGGRIGWCTTLMFCNILLDRNMHSMYVVLLFHRGHLLGQRVGHALRGEDRVGQHVAECTPGKHIDDVEASRVVGLEHKAVTVVRSLPIIFVLTKIIRWATTKPRASYLASCANLSPASKWVVPFWTGSPAFSLVRRWNGRKTNLPSARAAMVLPPTITLTSPMAFVTVATRADRVCLWTRNAWPCFTHRAFCCSNAVTMMLAIDWWCDVVCFVI